MLFLFYQGSALPTELHQHEGFLPILFNFYCAIFCFATPYQGGAIPLSHTSITAFLPTFYSILSLDCFALIVLTKAVLYRLSHISMRDFSRVFIKLFLCFLWGRIILPRQCFTTKPHQHIICVRIYLDFYYCCYSHTHLVFCSISHNFLYY